MPLIDISVANVYKRYRIPSSRVDATGSFFSKFFRKEEIWALKARSWTSAGNFRLNLPCQMRSVSLQLNDRIIRRPSYSTIRGTSQVFSLSCPCEPPSSAAFARISLTGISRQDHGLPPCLACSFAALLAHLSKQSAARLSNLGLDGLDLCLKGALQIVDIVVKLLSASSHSSFCRSASSGVRRRAASASASRSSGTATVGTSTVRACTLSSRSTVSASIPIVSSGAIASGPALHDDEVCLDRLAESLIGEKHTFRRGEASANRAAST